MTPKVNFRKPYVLKGLLFGLIIFALLFYIFYINFKGHLLALYVFLSFFFSAFCTNFFIRYFARRQNKRYLSQFQIMPELAAYQESLESVYTPEKKYDHFVLLLHGFTASPHEMQSLINELKNKKIPFIAPMLTGFGLIDSHLLEKVRHEDFFRTSLLLYDFLSQISHNVSIVGHSMGAVLATYIAQKRSVHRLILTAPALYFFREDKFIIDLLSNRIISTLFIALIPYLPKTMKKSSKHSLKKLHIANSRFQYLSIPTHAIKSMMLAKHTVDITKINPTQLSVIYGDEDRVVNVPACLSVLEKTKLPHKIFCITGSGHNLFEDKQKNQVSEIVISLLDHVE